MTNPNIEHHIRNSMIASKAGKRFRVGLACLLAILISLGTMSAARADQVPASNKLPDGFHFTAGNSPYFISSTLMIDAGATVYVDPGATIHAPSGQDLFWNHGSVIASGTTSSPVLILGNGSPLMKVTNAPKGASLKISHAVIKGVPALLDGTPSDLGSVAVSISDSDLVGLGIYAWYPSSFQILRNTFTGGGGIVLGFSSGPSPLSQASVTNNLFKGQGTVCSLYASACNLWVNVWASYGSPIGVHKNTFAGLSKPALNASVDGQIDASENFWGTRDIGVIQSYVLDKNDSFEWKNVIDVSNPLGASDPLTPANVHTPSASVSDITIGSGSSTLKFAVGVEFPVQALVTNPAGEPVAGVPVVVTKTISGQNPIVETVETSNDGEVVTQIGGSKVSTGKIKFQVGTVESTVNFEIGSPNATINVVKSTVGVQIDFACRNQITIRDGLKSLLNSSSTTCDSQTFTYKLSKGSHKLQVWVSGITLAQKTIKLTK